MNTAMKHLIVAAAGIVAVMAMDAPADAKVCRGQVIGWGEGTISQAKSGAVIRWRNWVAGNYGSSWANPSFAANRSYQCHNRGSTVECLFLAKPCTGVVAGRHKRRTISPQ